MLSRKLKSSIKPRIGIDLHGSEANPERLLEVVAHFSTPYELHVFGTAEVFANVPCPDTIVKHIVTEVISSEDDPLPSMRQKKDSSLCVGIDKLKHYEIDAFISAGNTGALMAKAKTSLPMLPGIDRPAFLALLPTKKDLVAVLDVGAGVEAKAENLLQFAQMGIAYQKTRSVKDPTVGLLNIGEEKIKGTPELRKAYGNLQKLPTFSGNVEGRDVFHGNIDVVVTDGFTGNIFLKTSEGIAAFVLEHIERLGPAESLPIIKDILKKLRERLQYEEYPGAILCGVGSIVIKCHGAITEKSLQSSIVGAGRLVEHFFLEKIKLELAALPKY